MSFNSDGYKLKFVQKDFCRDSSSHLYTYIYKFFSLKTKYWYILKAEYYKEDVFAVKFYIKQHSKSTHKYNIITNKNDVPKILASCANIIPILLEKYPEASFGFIGSRSFDPISKKIEGFERNQRFTIYRYFASIKFGTTTFTHIEYEKISGYLLLNNKVKNLKDRQEEIKNMFINTYSDLSDV